MNLGASFQVNLGEKLPIVVLKACPYVGASLYRLHMPSASGGRAGFYVNSSHAFPQGVLAVVTLVGCGAGDGGAKARARCEAGLPLCSVAITTPWRVRSDPKLPEQNT